MLTLLRRKFDFHSSDLENFLVLDDFNSEMTDSSLKDFCLLYSLKNLTNTAQKMKFFIKDFFSICDQIRKKLHIWSHLLKKSLIENFVFCAVKETYFFQKSWQT